MSIVGITKCPDYENVKLSLQKVIRLHQDLIFRKGDNILLKPNLLCMPKDEHEPVTTDPRFILALSEILIEKGCLVSIGDSPAFGTTEKVLSSIGILSRLKFMGVQILNLSDPQSFFSANTFSKKAMDFPKIINLPKLKVHAQFLFTGAVKNMFGFVLGKRKAILHMKHGDKGLSFVYMLLNNYIKIHPYFSIIDAIDVMDIKGPRKGVRKRAGLIISGKDAVAIDAVICQIVGIKPLDYAIIKGARELNIGQWDEKKIRLVGQKRIPNLSLQFPKQIPIKFSLGHVMQSVATNLLIKMNLKKQKG